MFMRDNMNEITKWVWSNLTQIKDILWIFFTLIATVIAVLTYKRARYTLLQPLRTEVIKKQTELFVEIITLISDDTKFFMELDLITIVNLNAYYTLRSYGYIPDKVDEFAEAYNGLTYCALLVSRSNKPNSFALPETFDNSSNESVKRDEKESKQDELIKGDIDIELIRLTESYYTTIQKLKDFYKNPFLPITIKNQLETIIGNIEDDVSTTLKMILEEFILEVYEKSKTSDVEVEFNGVYNQFNRRRKDNSKLINQIITEIRKYLLIDIKW